MAMTRNQRRQRRLWTQRLMAVVLLLMSVVFIWMTASMGEDIGGGLVTGALGFYLLLTRHLVLS